MSELETQLRRYGWHLRRGAHPVTLDEIFARRARAARRWSATRHVVVTAACVAAFLALAAVVDRMLVDRDQTQVATTDALPAVDANMLPHAIIVAGSDGVEVHPLEAGSEPTRLVSDPYYEAIRWAIPDGAGGLVYQHERTPPPWPSQTVLRLRAGSLTPEPLAGWPDPGAGPRDRTGSQVDVVGLGTADDGRAVLVLVRGNQVWGVDIDGDDRWLIAETDTSCIETRAGGFCPWAVVGGSSVGIVSDHDGCETISMVRLMDGSPVPVTDACLPDRPYIRRTLSDDGSMLGSLTVPFGAEGGVATDLTLAITDLASGELHETSMEPPAGRVVDIHIVARPGGWLVAVQTDAEVVFHDVASSELVPLASVAVTRERWTVSYRPLDLSGDATLGTEAGQVPCRPVSDRLVEQDLPPAVDVTRQRLFDLASRCAYEELAELAWEHDTLVSTEGSSSIRRTDEEHGFLSPDDLVRSWIAAGLEPPHGQVSLGEPLAWMAAVLNMAPTHVDEPSELAHRRAGAGESVWLWPRVVVDNSDEAWREVASIVGAAHVAEMRRQPGHGGRYAGQWVGISPDGTWSYFAAGDLVPTPTPVQD
jgi:hypothetical protein